LPLACGRGGLRGVFLTWAGKAQTDRTKSRMIVAPRVASGDAS
jgi:hypothetical protein